jgi:hypothetical protein
MNFRLNRRLAIIALLILVGGAAIWEFAAARASREDLLEANRRRSAIALESRALRASIAEMDRARDGLGAAATRAPEAAPTNGQDTPDQIKRRMHLLKAWIALRYAAFYRKAALTPEQVTQFQNIAANHLLQSQDLVATAKAENLTVSDPVLKTLGKQEYAQFQQQATAALGDPIFGEYQQYERTANVSMMTDGVAGNTYYTDPLNTQQADQLTQILANNSASYQKGQSASSNDIDFQSALAQAQTVLSATQLAALKNIYEGQQAGNTLNQLLATLTQSSGPPVSSPAK